VKPSHDAEPVIVRTSQFWATVCIHVPTLDKNAPVHSRRKSGYVNALKTRVSRSRTAGSLARTARPEAQCYIGPESGPSEVSMDDDRTKPLPPGKPGEASQASHEERVRAAFDDLGASLGDRATPEARASVENLRAAALDKDAARLRAHLDDVKAKHGWLWEELTTHPRVTALMNELALMGL
jgi:hypothetical protein